jgi:SAM-dependent methyltransferase
MSRVFDPSDPELMDREQPISPELEKDLANLVSLNRCFGSHRLLRRFLDGWLQPERCYRVLDLCTGAGDLPRVMSDWARARGITVRIDAVDANAATLEIARAASTAYPEITFLRGDALSHSAEATYDLVTCSLALHHFSEADAVRLLRRARELSHRFILVADLERCAATTLGVWLVTQFIYREPMTRHDGRVSAQRAFSFGEMRALAEQAGWRDYGHARFAFCRQALWLDTQDFAEIPLTAAIDGVLPSPA